MLISDGAKLAKVEMRTKYDDGWLGSDYAEEEICYNEVVEDKIIGRTIYKVDDVEEIERFVEDWERYETDADFDEPELAERDLANGEERWAKFEYIDI